MQRLSVATGEDISAYKLREKKQCGVVVEGQGELKRSLAPRGPARPASTHATKYCDVPDGDGLHVHSSALLPRRRNGGYVILRSWLAAEADATSSPDFLFDSKGHRGRSLSSNRLPPTLQLELVLRRSAQNCRCSCFPPFYGEPYTCMVSNPRTEFMTRADPSFLKLKAIC